MCNEVQGKQWQKISHRLKHAATMGRESWLHIRFIVRFNVKVLQQFDGIHGEVAITFELSSLGSFLGPTVNCRLRS